MEEGGWRRQQGGGREEGMKDGGTKGGRRREGGRDGGSNGVREGGSEGLEWVHNREPE